MSKEAVLDSIDVFRVDKGKEFDRVFLDVVDEVFWQVFGETVSDTILLHLERHNGLSREEIPHNVEEFSSGLSELLGSGAHILERLVIKLLYSRFQLEYEEKEGYGFSDYVKELRKGLKRGG